MTTVFCGVCNCSGQIENFDSVGACDGNVFCPKCSSEIEMATGRPALLCGECDYCKSLKEDEIFDDIQAERSRLAWNPENSVGQEDG